MQSKGTPEHHADPMLHGTHDDSAGLCPMLTPRHPQIKERQLRSGAIGRQASR